MTLVGDLSLARTNTLPSYTTGQVILDTVLPASSSPPKRLALSLSATFQAAAPGQPVYVSLFPDSVAEELAPIAVSKIRPIVIDKPLSGGDWADFNACCTLSAHRGAILGGGGVAAAPERYAIDFTRIDSQGDIYKPGAPPAMANNYSYGAHLLAVAKGTVVTVSEGLPEPAPRGSTPPATASTSSPGTTWC